MVVPRTEEYTLPQQTSQSIGTIRCEQQLQENLCIGCIEFPEQQERRCVIHFLPAGDDLGRRRFVREAMIGYDVSRDHRNLLSTLFFGRWEDERLFVAVECVEGRAVSELTEELRGRFTVIRAIAQACLQALECLHERGVAHGRVVGSNLLIGVDGVVRLGNFSRARRVDAGAEGDAAFQADLRALGELLFELIADIQLSQLQLFIDVQPGSCLPAETTPELVVLIEQLLGADGPVSASVALASLGGLAPVVLTDESEDPRRQLALLAGDPEVANDLLPPASEIDADIFSDDDEIESEEDLALLFNSVLSRLSDKGNVEPNGEDDGEPNAEGDAESDEPPAATAVPPPEPRPRRRNWLALNAAFTVLAMLLAVFSLVRGPAHNRVPDAQQAQADAPDELPDDLFDQSPFTPASVEADPMTAAESVDERAPSPPSGEAARVDGVAREHGAENPRAEGTSTSSGDSTGAQNERTQQRVERASQEAMFIRPTESRANGLHLVLEGGVVTSDGVRFFGYLTNAGEGDLQVAELELRGVSGQSKTEFSLEQRRDQCKSDHVIAAGARCQFFFEVSNFEVKPGNSRWYLVARDRAGLRLAIITLSEEL